MNKEDPKKKIVILSGVVILMLLFGACRFINNSQENEYTKMKQDAETIMEGIKNSDYESIQEIFSPYVKQRYPDLQSDIAELMGTIEGNIVYMMQYLNRLWEDIQIPMDGLKGLLKE